MACASCLSAFRGACPPLQGQPCRCSITILKLLCQESHQRNFDRRTRWFRQDGGAQLAAKNNLRSSPYLSKRHREGTRPACCLSVRLDSWRERERRQGDAHHAAQLGVPPAPFLLSGQGQPEELGPDLPPDAGRLPGPFALASAALPLSPGADQEQLCAGAGLARPLHLLALQPSQGVQRGGVDEEPLAKGHLPRPRTRRQPVLAPCLQQVPQLGIPDTVRVRPRHGPLCDAASPELLLPEDSLAGKLCPDH